MLSSSNLIRWGAVATILLFCVGCDQVTKEIARKQLDGRPPQSFLADTVRLVYAENPGAFLGLGSELPPQMRWLLLVAMNSLVSLCILGMLLWHTKMPTLRAVACTLLLSGAIGNLIDRFRFDGLVIDFMNVGVGPVRTGIFNVADVAISVGAILLILPHLAATPTEEATPVEE